MRLSESLRKTLIIYTAGYILNKFKLKRYRRNVLFFDKILAEYVKKLEKSKSRDLFNAGYRWARLYCNYTTASAKKPAFSSLFLLNNLLATVWKNIGLLKNIYAEKEDGKIILCTWDETPTKFIGPNNLMKGIYTGVLCSLWNKKCICQKVSFKKGKTIYHFKLLEKKLERTCSKSPEVYTKLNAATSFSYFENPFKNK